MARIAIEPTNVGAKLVMQCFPTGLYSLLVGAWGGGGGGAP